MQSSRESIGRLIAQVARNWRRAVNARMAPLGLTDATWSPLLFLGRVGPARQGELADYLGLDRSSVVRLIDTLEAHGLVERQEDPDDRRAKRIVLTEAAAPVLAKAQAAAQSVRAAALKGLSSADLARAEAVLDSILANLHAPTTETHGSEAA